MKFPTVPPSAFSEDPAPVTRTELLPAPVPPPRPMKKLPLEMEPPFVTIILLAELPLVESPMVRVAERTFELVVTEPPLTMNVLKEELEPPSVILFSVVLALVRMRVAPELVTPTLMRPFVPPLKLPAMTSVPFSTVVLPWKRLLLARVVVPDPRKERFPLPVITLERVVLSERAKIRLYPIEMVPVPREPLVPLVPTCKVPPLTSVDPL